MDVMARRRAIMAHIARLVKKIISSVTGLVSFVTNVEEPVKVVCEFSPAQEGTGDPSPDNVRPISGWTECEIYNTGINIWDEETEEGSISTVTGENIVASNQLRSKNYIPVKPGESYRFVVQNCWYLFYGKDKRVLTTGLPSSQSASNARMFVKNSVWAMPNDCYYIRFYLGGGYKPPYKYDCSINYPATETGYHPYQGETVPINWKLPDEYQEVEYLEANKKQYFWADIPIQDGLTVDAVQSFNAGDTFLFGGHADASSLNRSAFNGMYAGKIQGGYPSGYYNVGSGFEGGNRAVYHVVTTHSGGNRTVYVDDVLVSSASGANTVTETGAPCCVFANRALKAVGEDEANLSYAYSGRVYSLKVSKENVLLAYYVPCYRKSDSKPGMYDLVTGTFYVNQGTGDDFTVGPDASTLPGTVYGGTVTLNEDGSVDLVSKYFCGLIPAEFTSTGSWNDYMVGFHYFNEWSIPFPASTTTYIYDKCLNRVSFPDDSSLAFFVRTAAGNAPWFRLYVKKDLLSSEDAQGLYEWMASNPITVLYLFKTPPIHHFSNIAQLQSFLGTNNIWHNMNGDITVEYWNKQ